MFAVLGITGKVGGETAKALLAAGQEVRAVVRDAAKAQSWADQGCEIVVADVNDATALTTAFTGVEGVFVMIPPSFDPAPGFPEVQKIIASLKVALLTAQPVRIVVLSTVGAQATQENLLSQLGMMEQGLGDLDIPIAFLRPGWFIENSAYDVAPARDKGVIPSFLQPLDKPFPMAATPDIGKVAARLLQESWAGKRIVELETATRVSPNDIAAAFTRILGKPVRAEAVPRTSWEELFLAQGMKNPAPRIRMIEGFNEGWIDFEQGQSGSEKGETTLDTVLQSLIEQ